ncbi:hypothetical protein AB0C38_11545 [Amycolatopsis sp. NPDC048633]|uniref:hypothetical protein n=1 Tax=Amycolatopsis sp. NPDC048633 TaxID=3157095 RepID=UPI003403DA30
MEEDPDVLAELAELAQGLAGYLREADQVDRLLSLFHDDRRLARRFDPAQGSWDGYQEDVEAAWEALDRRLAAAGVDDPIPDLVRLALVRATLSSAEDLPPALIAAAVRTSAWTPERAASTIGRHPSPDHRAELLYELLRAVRPGDDLRQALTTQVAELAFLPAADLPAEALLTGLGLLTPAERITVVDRIAAVAVVLSSMALLQGRLRGPQVSPETAVHVVETIAEARRPRFIANVAAALLRELEEPRGARPTREESGVWRPLMDLQQEDAIAAAIDPDRARMQAAALLERLFGFLPTGPLRDRPQRSSRTPRPGIRRPGTPRTPKPRTAAA